MTRSSSDAVDECAGELKGFVERACPRLVGRFFGALVQEFLQSGDHVQGGVGGTVAE